MAPFLQLTGKRVREILWRLNYQSQLNCYS